MMGAKKTQQILRLGSKYFGRTIRAFRLSVGTSQEELAERASISVTLVGMIEREQGRLSEQTLCSICLGLGSEAGRPMLRAVYDGAMAALWEELQSVDVQMRKDRGLELPENIDDCSSAEEEFRRNLDTYIEAERKLASLVFRRGLGGCMPSPKEVAVPVVRNGRVRVRTKPRRNG